MRGRNNTILKTHKMEEIETKKIMFDMYRIRCNKTLCCLLSACDNFSLNKLKKKTCSSYMKSCSIALAVNSHQPLPKCLNVSDQGKAYS